MADQRKALIVDDEESLRFLVRQLLEGQGFECTEAEDGQKAFREASTGQYDLITMDINMPHWDGVDAAKSLSLIGIKPKFICISGFITDEVRNGFEEEEADVIFIDKPFTMDQINEAIANLFPAE